MSAIREKGWGQSTGRGVGRDGMEERREVRDTDEGWKRGER